MAYETGYVKYVEADGVVFVVVDGGVSEGVGFGDSEYGYVRSWSSRWECASEVRCGVACSCDCGSASNGVPDLDFCGGNGGSSSDSSRSDVASVVECVESSIAWSMRSIRGVFQRVICGVRGAMDILLLMLQYCPGPQS